MYPRGPVKASEQAVKPCIVTYEPLILFGIRVHASV